MIVHQTHTAPTVSLETIQRITATSILPVVPSTISRRLSEAGLRSQRPLRFAFDPTTSAESSGVVSQPIIMAAISLASYRAQR
ncbi:hypothetical protein X975_02443, partial [Stegodyphus mimosarum]